MEYQRTSETLQQMKRDLRRNLDSSLRAFHGNDEDLKQYTYSKVLATTRQYALQFEKELKHGNPLVHAVERHNRVLDTNSETSDFFFTESFFDVFNDFEKTMLPTARHKSDRHRELAGLYLDITLSKDGFSSETPDFDMLAAADTFFARGRGQYQKFAHTSFWVEQEKKVPPKKSLDVLWSEHFHNESMINSLYPIALQKWEAYSEIERNPVLSSLIARKPIPDYRHLIEESKKNVELRIYPIEQIDLSFLRGRPRIV